VGTIGWYVGGPELRRSSQGTVQFDPRTGEPLTARGLALYGPADDVRDGLELVNEWSLTIAGLGRLKYGGAFRGAGRAYCEGFARALLSKILLIRLEEKRPLSPGGGTSSLVVQNAVSLIEAKRKRGQEFLRDQLGIRLQSFRTSQAGSWHPDATEDGARDGSRASFSRHRAPKLGKGPG
jgi:hypothetical protein